MYEEGTLAIDIFDGATRQPVWHGRASKEITDTDAADPGPAIRKAVAAILAKFSCVSSMPPSAVMSMTLM